MSPLVQSRLCVPSKTDMIRVFFKIKARVDYSNSSATRQGQWPQRLAQESSLRVLATSLLSPSNKFLFFLGVSTILLAMPPIRCLSTARVHTHGSLTHKLNWAIALAPQVMVECEKMVTRLTPRVDPVSISAQHAFGVRLRKLSKS
jgi:hypothetical protein